MNNDRDSAGKNVKKSQKTNIDWRIFLQIKFLPGIILFLNSPTPCFFKSNYSSMMDIFFRKQIQKKCTGFYFFEGKIK